VEVKKAENLKEPLKLDDPIEIAAFNRYRGGESE